MFLGSKEKKRCQNIMLLISIFTFIGSSCAWAKPPSFKRVKRTPAQQLQFEIDTFRMCLKVGLKESVLQQISAEDTKSRITELGNWPYPLKNPVPKEVASTVGNKDVRIRHENDFVTIWYHSPVSLVKDKDDSLDIFRDVVNDILGESFVIGGEETLSTGPSENPNAKISAYLPVKIPGTEAMVFGYGFLHSINNTSPPKAWCVFESVSVLVNGKDAIIVLQRKFARRGMEKPTYEGLKAAKIRQSKEEKEKSKAKPVLARNVIFDEKIDTKGIPDALLNGCMWPIDDKAKVGIKDVGSASKLRPSGKKWNKKKN